MILRSAVFALVLAGLSQLSASATISAAQTSEPKPETFVLEAKKGNKKSKLQQELEKAVQPLMVLKEHLEAHIPQRELNTLRRLAFRILLIARQYL